MLSENLELENIEQLLSEADYSIQQINSDAISEMQKEHRLQIEKHAQELKKCSCSKESGQTWDIALKRF